MPDGPRGLRRRLVGMGALDAGMLVVSGTAFVYGSNATMFRPIIAPYAVSLGAGPFAASMAVAAISVAGVFLAMPAGFVAQRFGEGWILMAGGLLMSASGILAATVQTRVGLFAAMALAGVATVGIALSVHGLATAPVANGAVDTRRVAAFGIFASLGQMFGPVIGGVLSDARGYPATFWAVAILGVVMAAVGVLLHRMDVRAAAALEVRDAATTTSVRSTAVRASAAVLRLPGVTTALVLSSLGTLLLTLRTSFLPLYLDQIGWTPSEIGWLLSGAAGASLLLRVGFPPVERRLRASTMFAVCLVVSALALATATATTSVTVIVVATWTAGGLLGVINPASLTLLSRLVVDGQRRLVLGVRITARNSTQFLGPAVFGALAGVATVRVAFLGLTLVSAATAGIGTLRLRRSEAGLGL